MASRLLLAVLALFAALSATAALPAPASYTVRFGHHNAVADRRRPTAGGSQHASDMSRLVRQRAAHVAALRRERLRRDRARL